MSGRGHNSWFAAGLLMAATFGLAGARTAHATPPDAFSLGESQLTHDLCDARADDHDPATQMKDAQSWRIQCRGRTSDFGRIYVFDDQKALPAAYTTQLATRATKCGAAVPATNNKIPGLTLRTCVSATSGQPYVVYMTAEHSFTGGTRYVIGEGLQSIDDTIQHSVVIALGKAPAPPAPPLAPQSASDVDTPGTNAATRAEMAYQQNQSWRFTDAANHFSAIALDEQVAPAIRADAYLNWALNESNSGRFDNAAHLFDDARTQIAKVADPVLEARANNYEALDARNRGDLTVAVQKAKAALAFIEQASTNATLAATTATGPANVINDDLSNALNGSAGIGLTEGLSTSQKLDILAVQSWYIIGSCETENGDFAAAHTAISSAEKLFSSLSQANNAAAVDASTPFLKAQVISADARLARLEGDRGKYLALSVQALQALRTENDFSGTPAEGGLLLEKARAEAENGQTQKALSDFNDGLAIFRDPDVRGSLGASADVAKSYFDLLLQLRQQDPAKRAQYDQLFFTGMQSVVDVTTADTMKALYASLSTGDSETAAKARQYEDTRRRLALVKTQQQQMIDAGTYVGDARTRVDAQLAGLNHDLDSSEQQLVSMDPHYSQIVHADATVSDVQASLQPGEVYAKVTLLSDAGYGLVITPTSVSTYRIDQGRDQVSDTVARLRAPFDSDRLPVFNVPMSHDLYKTVFGPAAPTVATASHIIYEPDTALFGLPAGVFVTDDKDVDLYKARFEDKKAGKFNDPSVTGGIRWLSMYDGMSWLGRKTDITLTVSASSFIQARKAHPSEAPKSFLGFAAPVTQGVTDPRLFSLVNTSDATKNNPFCSQVRQYMTTALTPVPGMADVANAVAKETHAGQSEVVLGADFTDSSIDASANLKDYRIVFFGTHGLLPADTGDCLREAALVTSLGSDLHSDGLLTASEIFTLKLNADLVVLAACDTGRSNTDSAAPANPNDADANGGALDGLARAFIYAGARNLVVSHWQIPTTPTTKIMTAFFANGQLSQADSLRQAQLQLMNDPAYAHPYYWAFFSVVGDGARPIPGL